MTTFLLTPEQVDATRLQSLIADAVSEGRQLDYKEKLPGGSDEDKREFLADVTSLANGAGGDIIYGIRERHDERGVPTGIPEAVVGLPGLNLDSEQLRLSNIMREGVAPRLSGVAFREIRRDPEPPCLLLRVPRSWAGLHMVTFKNLSRFYSRTSAGKYQLDVHEIRAGFVSSERVYDRASRFRVERIARILASETPVPLGEGPKAVLHALPIASADVWRDFQGSQEPTHPMKLTPLAEPANNWRYNLEGFVAYTLHNEARLRGYVQLFRDGGIETVSGRVIVFDSHGGFYGNGLEKSAIKAFTSYAQLWSALGVEGPILVGLTLSGVQGRKIFGGPWPYGEIDAKFDRDILIVPEVVIDDLSIRADLALRPILDMVWNAGGWTQSPSYKDGRWVEPR